MPPPPIEKDSIRSRSASSSQRQPPPPPPKERKRSRPGSTLQLVSTNPDLLAPPNGMVKRRPNRRRQHAFFHQLASIKHWFIESAKRAKSPVSRSDTSTLRNSPKERKSPIEPRRTLNNGTPSRSAATPTRQLSGASYPCPGMSNSRHRSSVSPAPMTPRSSYRRSSGGLRGRKSTSSSVSSIRSIHHAHTHSKASSTSSTSNSVHSSIPFSKTPRSPHTSVKVLPATPTVTAFPSNIRLVRAVPHYNESANLASSGALVFAKRKKKPFRGPMLSIGNSSGGISAGGPRDSSMGGSRSASAGGRTRREIIEEEDEDEVEEVDTFSPLAPEAEETIVSEGNKEAELDGWVRRRHD